MGNVNEQLRQAVVKHIADGEGFLGARIYVSPAVEEAAILETLYEQDKWMDSLSHVCSVEVEVDADLPDGSAYVVSRERMGPVRRLSDYIALAKYGPRVHQHSVRRKRRRGE